MNKLIVLVMFLCAPSLAWANACSSAGSGNWNSAATWTSCGGTFPGNGDTFTINSGHTVTVATSTTSTVGTSPAGCTLGSGCTLIGTISGPLVVNGTLIVRGSITQDNVPVTCNADGAIQFDASLASSPTSQTYAWKNNGFFVGARVINGAGTSGHPCTISSNASGGNGYFWSDAGFSDSQNWNATYTNFTRIGDATNPAIEFNASTGTFTQTCTHCIFDTTGVITSNNPFPAGTGYDFENSTWKNSIGLTTSGITYNISFLTADTTPTSTRKLVGNVFDQTVKIGTVGGTFTGNEFLAGFFPVFQSTTTLWTTFSGNLLVIKDVAHSITPLGTVGANYVINLFSTTPLYSGSIASTTSSTLTVAGTPWTVNQFATGTNSYDLQITSGACIGESHNSTTNTTSVDTFLYPLRCTPTAGDTFAIYQSELNTHWGFPTSGTTQTYTGGTWEQMGTDSNGDWSSNKQTCTGTAVSTTTITLNLTLPSASLDNPGVSTNLGNCVSPNYQWFLTHNTLYSGGQPALAVGEQGVGVAGTIQQMQDNSVWNYGGITYQTTPAGGNALAQFVMSNAESGSFTPVTGQVLLADHNGKFNLNAGRAGTPGGGYDIINPGTGSFGTGDVVGDPQFVDPLRNMWTFGLNGGCSGSRMPVIQCVLNGIGKMNDPTGYNSAFSISNLITFVRAGFAPTNTTYHNTAHDGTDIGAIPWQSGNVPRVNISGSANRAGSSAIQ